MATGHKETVAAALGQVEHTRIWTRDTRFGDAGTLDGSTPDAPDVNKGGQAVGMSQAPGASPLRGLLDPERRSHRLGYAAAPCAGGLVLSVLQRIRTRELSSPEP